MKTRNKLKSTFPNIFIGVLSILVTLSSCHSKDEAENKDVVQASNVPTVLVSEAQAEDFNSSITIAGIAQANQEVKVFAMSDGYVKTWKPDIGDIVKKNETLAILGNPELMEQQVKAQAELDGDKTIYDRLEAVYKKTPELIPLQQVDEAKAKYESAQAQLNAINAQISYLTVTSPFSGVITERYIDTGAVVQDGLNRLGVQPLFKIEDISVIRVNVNIPEVNASYITKGTPVNVVFPDLPNTTFNGKVSRVSYGLSEDTKTMLAQIDIPNKESKIHPGMYANVIFQLSSQPNTLSIPNQAISVYEQEQFVYKVVPIDSGKVNADWGAGVKCRLQKVKIKVGIQEAERSELQYADLKNGDMLVTSGKNQCTDGAIVIAKQKGPAAAATKTVSVK